MEYPEKFKQQAKKLYPNWKKLHELMDKGSVFVVGLLKENQPTGSIPIVTVLNAETIEELHELANIELEKSKFLVDLIVFIKNDRERHRQQILSEIEQAHARGEVLT